MQPQADKLAGIMRRDDVDGMGKAMKILSAEWQALPDLDRKPYLDREEEDRARYQRECRDADEAAYLAQQERMKKKKIQPRVTYTNAWGRSFKKFIKTRVNNPNALENENEYVRPIKTWQIISNEVS